MAKEDVFQHNFRLNLNNPIDLKIHQKLMNINMDIYKSKNNYMVKKIHDGIFGKDDENEDQTYNSMLANYVTKEDLEELEQRLTDRIMKELLSTILSSMAVRSYVQSGIAFAQTEMQQTGQQEESDEIIDQSVAEVACDYFPENF